MIYEKLEDDVYKTANFPTYQTIQSHYMSGVNNQSIFTVLTVISGNMEDLTASKASILSNIYNRERESVVTTCAPQQTHGQTNLIRPSIDEMSLVAECPHNTYSSATFIRDVKKVENVYERVQGTVSK